MTVLQANWLRSEASQVVTGLLSGAGFQVYFVGGCVRNALVGMPVSDLDLSTDARPEAVAMLAKDAGLKVIPTGIEHGTVTVVVEHTPFEITTFRKDIETDGRRAVVAFSNHLEEDAVRRDFTMNALYAGADGQVIDPVGGIADLQACRVRFINDPEQRIREDYLRVLRFFRFHAWFGDPDQGLDPDGLAACAANLDGLDGLAKERVQAEVFKTLMAPDPAPAFAAMQTAGVLHRLLPGSNSIPLAPLIHLEAVTGLPARLHTRLAAINPLDAVERLRLSKADAAGFKTVREGAVSANPAGQLGFELGKDVAHQALLLRAAMMGQNLDPNELEAAEHGSRQVFPINAADLMPEYEGPALGAQLAALREAWLASGFALTRDELLALR